MMIAQQRLASRDLMEQFMKERVPLNKRLEGVYIPTILTDNVCFLSEYMFDIIKAGKFKGIGAITKRMKKIIQDYRRTNLTVMHEGLYGRVYEASQHFFQFLESHLIIDQCTYTQELWKQYPHGYGKTASIILAYTYFTKKVVEYIIQYERDCAAETQGLLGNEVRYVAHDNETCVAIMKCLKDLIQQLHGPEELDGYHIQLSYQIFKNKVKRIDVTSMIGGRE